VKIPRDLDAKELIKLLAKHGYEPTRQTGSHIRLTTQFKGQHHITIPNHTPLKIGTLNAIISEVAQHLDISKEQVLSKR
jgi:predicted RNA binding protein YcfA (HicA-like mRNA interferase family)